MSRTRDSTVAVFDLSTTAEVDLMVGLATKETAGTRSFLATCVGRESAGTTRCKCEESNGRNTNNTEIERAERGEQEQRRGCFTVSSCAYYVPPIPNSFWNWNLEFTR